MKTLNIDPMYRPRVKLLERRGVNPRWWVRYYLPGIQYKVTRPLGNDPRVARQNARLKEKQLENNSFSEWDRKKMGLLNQKRWKISEGVQLYLKNGMLNYSAKGKDSVGRTIPRLFSFFTDQCGRTFLDEISESDFDTLKTFLLNNGFRRPAKKLTVNRYQKWLITALNWMVKHEYLENNPFKGITPIRLAKSEKVRAKVIPLEDWEKIITAKKPEGFGFDIREIVIFNTATGLRRSEILHLQWSDLDFVSENIKIRSKPECPTRYGLGWTPKWSVEGDIPMNQITRLVLSKLNRQEVWGRYQLGNSVKETTCDFVFSRKKGKRQVRIDTVRKAWARLLENAGMKGKYQFKDLRATANTYFKVYCEFTQDEASKVLRNSPEVNLAHYTATIGSELRRKMGNLPVAMEDAVKKTLNVGNTTVH